MQEQVTYSLDEILKKFRDVLRVDVDWKKKRVFQRYPVTCVYFWVDMRNSPVFDGNRYEAFGFSVYEVDHAPHDWDPELEIRLAINDALQNLSREIWDALSHEGRSQLVKDLYAVQP